MVYLIDADSIDANIINILLATIHEANNKCLSEGYSCKIKAYNQDEFRYKRVELLGELLEWELMIHFRHVDIQTVKPVIRFYTREDSVKNLERNHAAIVRATAAVQENDNILLNHKSLPLLESRLGVEGRAKVEMKAILTNLVKKCLELFQEIAKSNVFFFSP
ncbi:hypothetical protein L1887_14361 [Cichorium endivia]|nr:hypothetical protein L1887_14361 [Cichorium endivia]